MESPDYNRMLFEKSVIGLALCKMDGTLVDVNQSYASILGLSVEEALLRTYWEVTPLKYSDAEQYQLECMEEKGQYGPYEKEYIHADAHLVPVRLSGQIVKKDGEKYILSSVEDITDRRKAEAEIARLNRELEILSFQDGLTSIANRRMFDLALDREWSRARREQLPLSLLLIDIDYFKQYNDKYGHYKGDQCLKLIASELNKISKRTTDTFARYGGEEFALLLPNTSNEDAIELAEKCRSVVSALQIPHTDSGLNNLVTLSVGVSTIIPAIDDQEPASILIDSADKLLYKAKNNGRNQIEY